MSLFRYLMDDAFLIFSRRHRHAYTRHGTTSLFAALDIATDAVIGRCYLKL